MKALIFHETGEPNGVLRLAEIPTPPLALDEALVLVLLSRISPSDLHMVRGRYVPEEIRRVFQGTSARSVKAVCDVEPCIWPR